MPSHGEEGSTPVSASIALASVSATEKSHETDAEASADEHVTAGRREDPLGWFGKCLPLTVAVAMATGTLIGYFVPEVGKGLSDASVARINLPIAIMVWLMVFPMMLHVDLAAIRMAARNGTAIFVTSFVNYAIQPFMMYALVAGFVWSVFGQIIPQERQAGYVAGAVILGGAPCTAMVFVWSLLVHGDASYTLAQVAINNAIMLAAYVPTTGLLIQAASIDMPWDTMALSVGLFIVVPLCGAVLLRRCAGQSLAQRVEEALKPVTMVALVLTLLIIFAIQGEVLVANLLDIALLAVPITLQSYATFTIAYTAMYFLSVPHDLAAPGALIAASNFFELAVAVAVSLYGGESPAVVATVVGVLTEVPVMLTLCWLCNATVEWFPAPRAQQEARLSEDSSTEVVDTGGPRAKDARPPV